MLLGLLAQPRRLQVSIRWPSGHRDALPSVRCAFSSAGYLAPHEHPARQAGQGALASLPGLGSVPPKLVKRIQGKEYVDIGELLPETWQLGESLLPFQAAAPQFGDRYKPMDGVLCGDGRDFGCYLHGEGSPVLHVLANNYQGQSEF